MLCSRGNDLNAPFFRNIEIYFNRTLNLNFCIQQFVDALVVKGLRHVVVSPGSRNFPLVQAFSKRSEIKLHSVIDERSAGFHGLGMSMALNEPVAVCCTSGTAATNLYPAITEAYYAHVPLLVLTADRPPEQIDNWEGQAIRQNELFKNHIYSSYTTPDTYQSHERFVLIGNEAMDQVWAHQGPIHVNLPLREPFYQDVEVLPLEVTGPPISNPKEYSTDLPSLPDNAKIWWLNGYNRIATQLNYPHGLVVFSDILSNNRDSIEHWEAILMNHERLSDDLVPDLVMTTGRFFVSKALRRFLENQAIQHWHIGYEDVPKPFGVEPTRVGIEPEVMLHHLNAAKRDSAFEHRWFELSRMVHKEMQMLSWEDFNESTIAKFLYQHFPSNSIVHAANSMPIRLLGMQQKRTDILHYGNRGTSGIDGSISTALGFAKMTNQPVFMLTGDLSYFYDINAFFTDVIPQNFKVIILNNGGGGIFEMIDGPNRFEQALSYQTTNHNRTAEHSSADFGLSYYRADDWTSLKACFPAFIGSNKCSVLEVHTNRQKNSTFYKSLKQINLNYG